MVPEDAVFWISALADAPNPDPSVLCRRHADAMVVPRGWTLDDRRESTLRLFKPGQADASEPRVRRRAPRRAQVERPEQLQIDGTGETPRPAIGNGDAPDAGDVVADDIIEDGTESDDLPPPWQPDFDHHDDLDGLLEVSSPLLARAFRGTGRSKG